MSEGYGELMSRVGRLNLARIDLYGLRHLPHHVKRAGINPQIWGGIQAEIEHINQNSPCREHIEN